MNTHSAMSYNTPEFDPPVRGDTITGDRYWSSEYMDGETRNLWPKVWHLGGMVAELEEEGDWVCHNFGKESVIMVRQEDGGIRAFYNACRHRGNRLVNGSAGGADHITCGYHGWQYSADGVLRHVQDANDFVAGNPCGKVSLVELRCEIWEGLIFWNMDKEAKPLLEWLEPLPERIKSYGIADWVRVMYLSADCNFNWKIVRDNFNESYHLPTIHPELATFINDGLPDTVFEMYASGHNGMWMKGHQATTRVATYDTGDVPTPLDLIAQGWGIDPADYKGHTNDLRAAIIKAKRELGPGRGFTNYAQMTDQQLVDYYHVTLFPNLTLTFAPEALQVLRTEPHPTDPEKCIFDHWYIAAYNPAAGDVASPIGMLPLKWAEKRHSIHGDGVSLGAVADQDLSIATNQQLGLNSRGYTGAILTHQEKRVQRFHELLDDVVLDRG
jgi:phenylpropionate dioxygenase-like ring-hydroxylating dioxygenase large terminal subunit